MTHMLVIAPHPDDETLGCGGTMLRASRNGARVSWLLATSGVSVTPDQINAAASALGVCETIELGHDAARLDAMPLSDLVAEIGGVVDRLQATDVYLPFRRDAHTDHAVVFDAGAAATKWFRHGSVRRVLAYETPSETDFDIAPDSAAFRPNVFVDISKTLEAKIAAARIYAGEVADHPFPRSPEGLRALATLRGAASGFHAAEAFMLLRDRI